MTIVRDGAEKTRDGEARRGEPAEDPRATTASGSTGDDKAALGIAVAPLTPELADRLGVAEGRARASSSRTSIRTAARRTPACRRATSSQQVNRQPVQSVDELRAAVKNGGDKPVLLLVNRKGTRSS